jgi:hypothetical protein
MVLATFLIVPCLREKIFEIIKNVLKNLKFNGVIMYVTATFLDLSFTFVT